MKKRVLSWWGALWTAIIRAGSHCVRWTVYHVGFTWFATCRLLSWLGGIAISWWRSRRLRYLLQGLPALAAATAIAACAFIYHSTTAPAVVSSYRTLADRADRAKDYETAYVAYERLAALVGDSLEYRFHLAKVLKELGHTGRSQVLLAAAAPVYKLGYPPAHFYRAAQLLKKKTLSDEELQDLEAHLLRTIQGEPDALFAHALLGQMYYNTGRPSQAVAHLEKASRQQRELNLMLASVYRRQKKEMLARHYAKLAAEHFAKTTSEDLDNHDARLGWAQSLVLLKSYPEAIQVLSQGLRLSKWESYRKTLGLTFAAWSDEHPDDPGRQLELLERGLEVDPFHPALLQRLVKLTSLSGDKAVEARAALQKLLAEGKGSAYLHLFLGVDAYQRGQLGAAEGHLTLAYQLNEGMPVIANNLAWVLARHEKPDLNRALRLVNSALQQEPENLRFLETRGQIYVKMKRWKQALGDLVKCLPAFRQSRDVHQALEKTYSHLQMPEMAAQHRRKAELLEDKSKAPAP